MTAVRKSTCQIGMPHCGRDRVIVDSFSAASFRGIPQCDGKNINSTERPRFTKESGIIPISSVMRLRMASGTTRGASIADRESVASRIRVGDWDVSRRGGIRCLKPFSVARHSALYEPASCCTMDLHTEIICLSGVIKQCGVSRCECSE
ncbi:thimet oligopeptidase [Trypanosoma cruzi]|nr:thimet oligopeptidase [Trypanosoma cruzi]